MSPTQVCASWCHRYRSLKVQTFQSLYEVSREDTPSTRSQLLKFAPSSYHSRFRVNLAEHDRFPVEATMEAVDSSVQAQSLYPQGKGT